MAFRAHLLRHIAVLTQVVSAVVSVDILIHLLHQRKAVADAQAAAAHSVPLHVAVLVVVSGQETHVGIIVVVGSSRLYL